MTINVNIMTTIVVIFIIILTTLVVNRDIFCLKTNNIKKRYTRAPLICEHLLDQIDVLPIILCFLTLLLTYTLSR